MDYPVRSPGRWEDAGPVIPPASALPSAQPAEVLSSQTNTAILGPSRVLNGNIPARDIIVPAVAVQQAFVALSRNDSTVPKSVRLRLARNSTEGRIALSGKSNPGGTNVLGVYTPINCEYIDLTHGDRCWEGVLLQGEQLWAIGSWVGIVPVSIVVTVLEWTQ